VTSDRCPQCGAACRSDVDWCPLCFADRRPAAIPIVVRVPNWVDRPGAASAVVESPPVTPPPGGPTAIPPGWPCPQCHTNVDLAADICPVCGGRFLAALADAPAVEITLPGIGRVSTGTRRGRVTLATAVGTALLTAIVLTAFVLGSML
jgi:predicted amidophosphoribosyltransferase